MRTHVSSTTIGRFPCFAERRFDIPHACSIAQGFERGSSRGARIAGRDDPGDHRAVIEDGHLFTDTYTIHQGRQALREIREVDVR